MYNWNYQRLLQRVRTKERLHLISTLCTCVRITLNNYANNPYSLKLKQNVKNRNVRGDKGRKKEGRTKRERKMSGILSERNNEEEHSQQGQEIEEKGHGWPSPDGAETLNSDQIWTRLVGD